MITNANRSGSVRVDPKEDRHAKPKPDENRSGSVSEREANDKKQDFGRRQKIIEIDGQRVLVDV